MKAATPNIFKSRRVIVAPTRAEAIAQAIEAKTEEINSGETMRIEIDCGSGEQENRFTLATRTVEHYEYQKPDIPNRFNP